MVFDMRVGDDTPTPLRGAYRVSGVSATRRFRSTVKYGFTVWSAADAPNGGNLVISPPDH